MPTLFTDSSHIMHLYFWIKTVHVTTVAITGSFFALRFFWMIKRPELLQRAWVKNLPVLVDTLLLASGISMAVLSHQSPLVHAWLSAKLIALLAYIILGSIALKRGGTRRTRLIAGVAALATFAYIVSVALSRTPFPVSAIF